MFDEFKYYKPLIKNKYIIFIFIFLKTIFSEEIIFNYKYAKFLELLDENYIMCTEKDISIYDSTFKINYFLYNFTTEVKGVDDFQFVTISQYPNEDGGNIIVLYKTKAYLIYSSYSRIIEANLSLSLSSTYYTLVPYKVGNNYNFIIGYISVNIKLAYFKFNLEGNKLDIIEDVIPDLPKHEGDGNIASYLGYSCHIMISDSKGEVLTCFYERANIFGVCSFNLETFEIIEDLCNLFDITIMPGNIHSDISQDKSKALICFINNSGNEAYCLNYDINEHKLSNLEKSSDSCSKYASSLNIFYSKKSQEYIFSCINYGGEFTIVKFDKDFNIITSNNAFKNDIGIVEFFTIIYDYENNVYSFISSSEGYKSVIINSLSESFSPVEKLSWFKDELIVDTDSSQYSNNIISDSITNEEIEQECPKEFLYQNKNTGECLKTCDISDLINNKCIIRNLTDDNINIIKQQIKNLINSIKIGDDTNVIIDGENSIYQIISSLKMNENYDKNLSIIDFGQCEEILKEEYGVDYLLIFKIDTKIADNSPVIVNYEVYNPNNLTKMNLELCKNVYINTYTKYYPSKESFDKIKQLNESGYDLYNINSSFYQDLCSPFTTSDGTDILLVDRKNYYFENISLCENSCTYSNYDYINQMVKCECKVKRDIEVKDKINSKIFFSNFLELDKFSNIKLLKCYILVFSKKGQTNNIGSYIFLVILFAIVILGIIYRIDQVKIIVRILRKIIKDKNPPKRKESSKKDIEIYKDEIIDNNINDKRLTLKQSNSNKMKIKKKSDGNVYSFSFDKNDNKSNSVNSSFVNKNLIVKNHQNEQNIKNHTINNNDQKEKIYKYNGDELNILNYDDAIKYDKRDFKKYYFSLIKSKQLIFFTFFHSEDYNVFIIKLALFLFSFSLYFTISALFFDDNNVHSIYEKKGRIDLLLQVPNILYSTLISSVISTIIKILALSKKDMLNLKKIENINEAMRESVLLKHKLVLKFKTFYIISFIFVTFFWYFIAAFCGVYKNTQTILFKNTLSSFGISMLYPFGLYLIPTSFRIISLKKKYKTLYIISVYISYI